MNLRVKLNRQQKVLQDRNLWSGPPDPLAAKRAVLDEAAGAVEDAAAAAAGESRP